jgi:hypothetical protein
MIRLCNAITLIIVLFFFGLSTNLFAAEIRVHNNKTLTVKGKTLKANCSETIVETGSSIVLDSAWFQDMGRRSGGGAFSILNDSKVTECDKVFYVIPRPDGKSTTICL